MNKSLVFLVAGIALASPASAQVLVVTTSTQNYVPLTGGTVLTGWGSPDDSGIVVPLGFSFPWYGSTYTSVLVQTNGFISFDTASTCVSGGCYSNTSLPNAATPNNGIYAWWDDMTVSGATVRTVSTGSEFTVEYSNLAALSGGYTVSMQIKLTAAGTVYVHYGPKSGTGGYGASAGFENSTGTQGANLLTCSATSNCTMTDWVPDTLYTIGEPLEADLSPTSVTISNLVSDAGNLSFTVNSTVRNFGRTAANSFLWNAYLSTDRALSLDGGTPDILVASGGPLSLPAVVDGGVVQTTITTGAATSTPPPTGNYFVLLQVDPTNVVTEASETNNVGSTANYFTQGLDLVATSIAGPANTGAGNVDSVTVNFFNQGTQAAGSVQYRILYSADTTLDASDFVVHNGTRAVTGGETVNEVVSVSVPANAPNGDFHYLLVIDPASAITEASETNNVVASVAKVHISRADLVNEGVDVVDTTTSLPVRAAKFGEPARMTVRVSNQGGANATNFKLGVVVSTDSSLSLLSDTLVYEQTVTALNAGATGQSFTLDFSLPLKDRANLDFTTGQYFLFVVVDSTGAIYESNKQNNNVSVGPVRISAPGPDLAVSTVLAPSAAGVGEIVPIVRAFRNLGNVDAPAAAYRYFASANTIVTVDDVPLEIVGANGQTSLSGTVTLARGAGSSGTDLVKFPGTMPPGQYYVGCLIDPTNQIAELDKSNNALASAAVQIAPSSLGVATTQLPDAIIGRPYLFRLAARGEQGASTWSVVVAQGELPVGLALSSEGLLSGTPSGAPVTAAFTVEVANNSRTAAARLALRVLPSTAQVEVTTSSIPALVNSPSTQLQFALGAAGGSRPYTWRIASGALPAGLALASDGSLTGSPRAGTPNGVTKVTFEVRDAFGGSAQRELAIRLVAAGSIVFRTTSLPDTLMGAEYAEDVAVQNLDGSPLSKPLVFSVLGGALPDGLSWRQESEVVFISGRATRSGAFRFTLGVEDALGRTDSLDFTITVYPPRYKINVSNLPPVLRPGDSDANVVFTVSPSFPVTYALVAGALPPGLTLSTGGVISGTVDSSDASLGAWNFVVEAKDELGSTGLAPYSLFVEKAPPRQGCSATGTATPFALIALAVLALRRRAPRLARVSSVARVVAPLVALVLALPGVASAQTYQVDGPRSQTFAPLASGTAISPTSSSGVNLTLPFAFNFFGQPTTTVTVSRYGYLVLGGGDATGYSNPDIPHSDSWYPGTFISPWWDDLSTTLGTFKWTVTGAAPNRAVVIEWKDVAYYSSTTQKFSMQVLLYEGTGQIRFAYSATTPGSGSASVGIQKQLGQGLAALSCSTTGACGVSNWPANQVIDFYLPPELRIASLSIDQAGYAGVAYRAAALVRNEGGRPASNVVVRFFLSTDATLDGGDLLIGDASVAALAAQQEALVTSTAPIPSGATPGNYFVIAKVDPDNTVSEQSETNNTSAPLSMTIGQPKADLTVSSLTAPASAAPGAQLQATRTLLNGGNAVSGDFKYTYFLSDNSVVSIADTALSPVGQKTAMAAAAVDTATEPVTLPQDLPAGMYWLGLCVNYDAAAAGTFPVDEISVVNNCATATSPILISNGTLEIITTSLPAATQYAPYGLRLRATGGNGQYAWSLDSGSLPTGLALTADGDLTGAPAVAATASFTVKVVSGSLEKTQALSLQITAGNIPLVVVDQELPAAEFGRTYAASLVAVGGKPPYQWALKGNAELPAGVALATDGRVEGRAQVIGEHKFTVEVTDAAGATSSKELKLKVVNPSTLSIATVALPTGRVRRDYLQELLAVGGRAPYSWAVTRFQQLPENPTEQPGPVLQTFPDNFGLVVEDGVQQDFLRGVPKLAGTFALTLQVTDAAGSVDRAAVLLYVTYTEGLAITTTLLPDGFVNQNYAVKLSHNGGREAEGISFSIPCVLQAVRVGEFACTGVDASQMLPPGLQLGSDGSIIGLPQGPEGTYTFLVKVVDAWGRQDTRGLSIRIKPDYSAQQQGGCSGMPFGPSALGLLSLTVLALRRRRQ